MVIGAAVGAASSAVSQYLSDGCSWENFSWGQFALDTVIGGISGALGASGISKVISIVAGGVLGFGGSVAGDLIASKGNWNDVKWGKALLMGAVGAGLGAWTGAGSQNTKSMIDDIMLGKSWGSKAFLNAANSLAKQPGNRTMTMIMYNKMAKAITKYQIQAIAKVGIGIGASTIGGSLLGGLFL